MKNYLVAFNIGSGRVGTTQIQVDDDYIPITDNMKKIKEAVIENSKPKWSTQYAAPSNCGGYISSTEHDLISVEELKIVAISNLDM